MWRDVEAAPTWHERIVEVRKTGLNTYHWMMRDEPGKNILEWDFEILADEPEKRIAWRSLSGEPEGAGEVIFESAPGGPRDDGDCSRTVPGLVSSPAPGRPLPVAIQNSPSLRICGTSKPWPKPVKSHVRNRSLMESVEPSPV